ncbi:MAG: SDR family oxidoreductase [Alicyclobacillaceae bacterium]|nr:SDR family oxidoreductase [Alicyclobacillaceae bacterium]
MALVTGASSGFGLHLSVALARQGHEVVAAVRNLARGQALTEAAREAGVPNRIHIRRYDVRNTGEAPAFIDDVVKQFGRLDILVNNAGYAAGGFVEDVPMEVWRDQFDTNFFGVVALTRAALPHMRRQHSGWIVNISSIGGRVAAPGMGPYVASKFALEGFTEALRMEMRSYGVHVILVEPGAYRTAIWEKGLANVSADPSTSPYGREIEVLMAGVRQVAERAGDPQEVVHTILRALAQPRPRLRYPVGRGVRAAVWSKAVLPWRLFEGLVANRFNRR